MKNTDFKKASNVKPEKDVKTFKNNFILPSMGEIQKMRTDMNRNYKFMVRQKLMGLPFLQMLQTEEDVTESENHKHEWAITEAMTNQYLKKVSLVERNPDQDPILKMVTKTIQMQTIYIHKKYFKISGGEEMKRFQNNLNMFNQSYKFWSEFKTDFESIQKSQDPILDKFREQTFECQSAVIQNCAWIQFFSSYSAEKMCFVHDVFHLKSYFDNKKLQMKQVYDNLLRWDEIECQIRRLDKYYSLQKTVQKLMTGMVLEQQLEMQDRLLFNIDNDVMRCIVTMPDLRNKGYMSQFVMSQCGILSPKYTLRCLKSVPPQSLGLENTHFMTNVQIEEDKKNGFTKRACLIFQKFQSEMMEKVPFFYKNAVRIIGSYIDPCKQQKDCYFSILQLKRQCQRKNKDIKECYFGDYVSDLYSDSEKRLMKERTQFSPFYFGGKIHAEKNVRESEIYLVVSYKLEFNPTNGMQIEDPTFTLNGYYEPDQNGNLVFVKSQNNPNNSNIILPSLKEFQLFEETIYGNQKTGQYLFNQENFPWLCNYLVSHYNFVTNIYNWLNHPMLSNKNQNICAKIQKTKLYCIPKCKRIPTKDFNVLEKKIRDSLGPLFKKQNFIPSWVTDHAGDRVDSSLDLSNELPHEKEARLEQEELDNIAEIDFLQTSEELSVIAEKPEQKDFIEEQEDSFEILLRPEQKQPQNRDDIFFDYQMNRIKQKKDTQKDQKLHDYFDMKCGQAVARSEYEYIYEKEVFEEQYGEDTVSYPNCSFMLRDLILMEQEQIEKNIAKSKVVDQQQIEEEDQQQEQNLKSILQEFYEEQDQYIKKIENPEVKKSSKTYEEPKNPLKKIDHDKILKKPIRKSNRQVEKKKKHSKK